MLQQLVNIKLVLLSILYGSILLVGCWHWYRHRCPVIWLVLIAICVGVPFALVAGSIVQEYEAYVQRSVNEVERLRELYPEEKIETRLPPRPPLLAPVTLSEVGRETLHELETSNVFDGSELRNDILRRLHQGSIDEFVRRDGFGVMRMLGTYSRAVLDISERDQKPLPQPGGDLSRSWEQVDLNKEPRNAPPGPLLAAHTRNTLDFVNPLGFGFMKVDKHVVGFQSHQFSALVDPENWKVQRLELVGLLIAEEPRVYVTPELPRMTKLRAAPTRPLDAFESAGLVKLQGGEELYLRATPDGIRMVGAVRSVKQCLKCHKGDRGDLLGAFSYFLEKKP